MVGEKPSDHDVEHRDTRPSSLSSAGSNSSQSTLWELSQQSQREPTPNSSTCSSNPQKLTGELDFNSLLAAIMNFNLSGEEKQRVLAALDDKHPREPEQTETIRPIHHPVSQRDRVNLRDEEVPSPEGERAPPVHAPSRNPRDELILYPSDDQNPYYRSEQAEPQNERYFPSFRQYYPPQMPGYWYENRYENPYSRSYYGPAPSQYLQSQQAAARQYWHVLENSEPRASPEYPTPPVPPPVRDPQPRQFDYTTSRNPARDFDTKRKNLLGMVKKSVGVLRRKNRQMWFTNFLLVVRVSGYEDHVNLDSREIIDGPESLMIRSALIDCTEKDDAREAMDESTPLSIVFRNIKTRYENVPPAIIEKYRNQWDSFTFNANVDRIRERLAYLYSIAAKITKARPHLSITYCRRGAIERLARALPEEYNVIKQMYTPHQDDRWRLDEFIDKLENLEMTLLGPPDDSESEEEARTDRGRGRSKGRGPARKVGDQRRHPCPRKNSPSPSPTPQRGSKWNSGPRKDLPSGRRCYICKCRDHMMKDCKLLYLNDLLKEGISKEQEAAKRKKKRGYAAESDLEMPLVESDEEEFAFLANFM